LEATDSVGQINRIQLKNLVAEAVVAAMDAREIGKKAEETQRGFLGM